MTRLLVLPRSEPARLLLRQARGCGTFFVTWLYVQPALPSAMSNVVSFGRFY